MLQAPFCQKMLGVCLSYLPSLLAEMLNYLFIYLASCLSVVACQTRATTTTKVVFLSLLF
jgi:hypothetical protein